MPAREGSRVDLFQQVLASIGDQQAQPCPSLFWLTNVVRFLDGFVRAKIDGFIPHFPVLTLNSEPCILNPATWTLKLNPKHFKI